MKLCIVRHHFFLWFLIDKPELLPFEGNWNTLIVLANESGRILSDITKHGNIIHVEKYGLEIDFKTFMNILNVPNRNNLFYYVVNRTYPFQFDRGVFIDPNNPF